MDRYEGFREFVVARGRALSRSAYLLTGDHHLAEDLLQTALARTAGHWRRIADGDPEAYVRRAMVNVRTSWWRRRRYSTEVLMDVNAMPPVAAVADSSETVVRRMALTAALSQLPARQRALIVLRFFDDLTEAQAAEALGCTVGTVKSQTHRALARLRALAPHLLADGAEGRRSPSEVA
jgi:RNA polymerase sigma-70 factor (sigma-E family)